MVISQTDQKGCDIVLSCVKGELKNVSCYSIGNIVLVIYIIICKMTCPSLLVYQSRALPMEIYIL